MSQSEVAQLREQIILEYQATQQVFTGFTQTAKHEYITKRQENIGRCYEELTHYVSPQEAIAVVAEAMESVQSSSCASSGRTS